MVNKEKIKKTFVPAKRTKMSIFEVNTRQLIGTTQKKCFNLWRTKKKSQEQRSKKVYNCKEVGREAEK